MIKANVVWEGLPVFMSVLANWGDGTRKASSPRTSEEVEEASETVGQLEGATQQGVEETGATGESVQEVGDEPGN